LRQEARSARQNDLVSNFGTERVKADPEVVHRIVVNQNGRGMMAKTNCQETGEQTTIP
jgi:hypothetical protein